MIAMQVSNEDALEMAQSQWRTQNLVLGPLSAIKQP
jgi:hypothetical protein